MDIQNPDRLVCELGSVNLKNYSQSIPDHFVINVSWQFDNDGDWRRYVLLL